MFHVQRIESLDLPELAPYRTMKRPVEHETQGIFVAEGDKVVHRLLESKFPVVSVLLPARRLAEFESLLRARPEREIPVFVVSKKSVLEELVGFEMFQGVLAIGRIPAHLSLDGLLSASPHPHLFVAMDELNNAENTGALVRNCAAFGVQGLIVGETSSSPFLRRSVRNSMGTIFQLPVIELNHWRRDPGASQAVPPKLRRRDAPRFTLAQTLRDLRSHGVRCIAAHPPASGKTLAQVDFTGDCCLVFGSEGHGISRAVLDACDAAVAISMANDVDSLNVGGAAAVFLYEVQRQRGKM